MRHPARPRRPLHLLPLLLLPCLLAGGAAPLRTAPARAQAAALSVRAVSPAPGATEVASGTAIVVAFDRPVVALTGLGAGPRLDPLVSSPPLSGEGRWLTSSIYTYQARDLRGATIYTLTVPTGLRAIDGTRLAQPYTWRVATQRPAVRDVTPMDGEDYALPQTAIAVTFNQRMDHATTQAAFHLRDAQGNAVAGSFSWRGDTMRFRPAASLPRTERYTASVDAGARSAEGPLPLLRPAFWRFGVAPYLRVTGSTPGDGGTLGTQNNGVEIDFTAPVTLTARAFAHIHIAPNPPNRYISLGDANLSYHIYGGFAPSTAYTVTIDAGLPSQAGDALRAAYRFRFVTAPLPPAVAFVTGPVATYDAYRPVILSLQGINPGPVTYTLYHIDRGTFLDDLANQNDLKDNVPAASQTVLTRTVPYRTVLNRAAPLTITATPTKGGPLPPGYYFVQATGQGAAADYQLLIVTRANITLKVAPRQILLWATDLRTGNPVPGLALAALHMPNSGGPTPFQSGTAHGPLPGQLGSGYTAADGTLLLRVHPPADGQPLLYPGVLAIGGRAADPVVASSNWGNGISPSDYRINGDPSPAPRRITVATDRPIYRPGQDVQLRGLVRADDDGQYSLVGGPVALTLVDPQGNVVARRTLALDRFGAFHTTLPLAVGASLGYYAINVTSGAQGISQSIQVAAYRKPTFAVTVTPARTTYVRGQTIEAAVQVQYYFGGPVAHARVHWSLLGYDYGFYSDLYGDYGFGAYDPAALQLGGPAAFGPMIPPPGVGGYTLYQGDAVTDARGMLHLRLPARLPKDRTVQGYSLEANVTDLDNQPVANTASVTVYASAVQVGLLPEQQVIDAGQRQTIRVVTLQDDGRTPAARQAVQVTVYRRVYVNRLVQQSDGTVDQQSVPRDTLLRTLSLTTDGLGRGAFSFAEAQGGEYHIVAGTTDRYGNRAMSTVEIYVGGAQPIDWGAQPQGHIRVIADRRLYHTGDVAHLLVTAPAPGMTALVSIERGAILSATVRRLSGTSTVLDVPILSSYLPDTYVSVVVEQGAGASGPPPIWRMGYADLYVDPRERQIRLTVTPAQPRVHPGAPVTLRIHATDRDGRPVRAQLALSVVDEAALALAGGSGNGGDLLDAFYGPRALSVFTADTLNVSPEQMLSQRPLSTDIVSAQGFGTLKAVSAPLAAGPAHSPATPSVSVRSTFADTAYWNAAVVTDARGDATLSVPLPDNLTTWQILGEGISADTLVGDGTARVVATRDLVLRPLLPRFFALGDRARIGATINNTTGVARTVTLRMQIANGDRTATGATRTIRLAPGAETDVTWPVAIGALGSATVQIEAADVADPAIGDAVRLTLPVRENSVPETVTDAGQVDGTTREEVRIPAGIEPDEGSLTVILEPTLAAGLKVGADFLRDYPYQSSIDLAARILGYAALGRLPARAGALDAGQEAALRPGIARDLARLYPMQHQDGGFGWWIDDPYSSPSITVSVVDALATARGLGYPIRSGALDQAVSYLISNARSPAALNAGVDYDADLEAGIVYAAALAGRGGDVAALAAQLFDVRDLLGRAGSAELALALRAQHTAASDAQERTLLANLTSVARLSAGSTHWEEPSYDWRDLDSDIATTATVLNALVRLDPRSPLIPGAVRWLMDARTAAAWQSTEATAVALQVLADYSLASGELNGHYRYTVQRNGVPWATGSVTAAILTQSRTLAQPIGSQAPAGSTQRLTISRQAVRGNGNLHYLVQLQYYRPVDRIAPAGDGVTISRRYLTPGGRSGTLGGTIRVQLTVTAPRDLFYVTLEDPLPAGAESVDSSLRTTSQLAQIAGQSTIPPGTNDLTWYVTHTDLRDDRTVLFLSFLPAGTYQYTYLIHLDTAGTFHALPARIGETYFPEVSAHGAGGYFTVR